MTALLTPVVLENMQVYRRWRGSSFLSELRQLLLAWLLIASILLFFCVISQQVAIYSTQAISVWLLSMPVLLACTHLARRTVLNYLRKHGKNSRTVVVVGKGEAARNLQQTLTDELWMGFRLQAVFSDGTDHQHIMHYVQERHTDIVFIALPVEDHALIRQLLAALQNTTASVYMIPDLFTASLLGERHVYDLNGATVISLRETPMIGINNYIKRLEDMVGAVVILCAVAPLMLIIAIIIRLTSPGDILFRQERYGLQGKKVVVWKFRTMMVSENGDNVQQARRNDERITPFGAFLRRTSLDELPQFFNVLKGDMSIVGPRPHAVAHNEEYRRLIPDYMLRHKVKPGITGWAQVHGLRGETDTLEKMEKRVEYDLWYINNWSVFLDIYVILLTIFKGFVHKNAY